MALFQMMNAAKRFGSTMRNNITRAQSTQKSKLVQEKEKDNARVSINQAMRAKKEKGRATTSVFRKEQGTSSTSIGRKMTHAKRSVFSEYSTEDKYDVEAADRRRYAHIQKLIREKQQQKNKKSQ